MAEGSICRNCFHSYVCEQFNKNKDDNNKKCHFFNDHYIPQTNDVEKVVYCKDCEYLMFSDCYGECEKALRIVSPRDYCSWGERRKNDR